MIDMLEFHIGNLYTKVDKKKATKEELNQIHKLLSVKIPGHYFSTSFRRGLWDGQKRFFNLLTGTFYTGLLPYTERELQLPFNAIDERHPTPHRNLPLNLNGIELRDYQRKMIEESVQRQRGIISAPPNAGKTEVACGIIQVLGLPAVFFTHRIALAYQTRERFEKRLGVKVGLVGGGIDNWIPNGINVVSVQTAYKKLAKFKTRLKDTPVVIVDECHHISAKSVETIMKECCSESMYKFGLSATPLLRDDVNNMIVRGLLGDEIIAVSSKELISSGVSAFPSVYLLSVREPKIPESYTFSQAYEKGVAYNETRNNLIVSSTKHFLSMGKSVFILVWRIGHGELLLDMLREKQEKPGRFLRPEGVYTPSETLVEFISGGDAANTQQVIRRFTEKTLKCVISSTISDEGLDVPAMDVLIIATGFKAPLKTIQRVGRGLRRKTTGQNEVSIVDFIDWHNKKYLHKHSVTRVKEYVKMEIPIFEVVDGDWERIEDR
jgi:superfamily II DNA or RNA helicase